MPTQQPTIQTMKISDVRTELNTLVNQVFRKETRVVVEKSGIPVAALVSTDDLARLDRLDRERAERFRVIDEMQAAFAGVPAEEIERETDRITAEIRAENRKKREDEAAAAR